MSRLVSTKFVIFYLILCKRRYKKCSSLWKTLALVYINSNISLIFDFTIDFMVKEAKLRNILSFKWSLVQCLLLINYWKMN